MPIDPLPYAAPIFLVALVIEGWSVRGYSRRLLSGLGCAAVDQITAAWGLMLFVTAFDAIHRGVAPLSLSAHSPLTWVVAVVGHDLAYYVFHRASHRVNLLWAAHVVHHQSESYDFTVSLRQGALATWITYAFYVPLALVIDAQVFLIVHAAYQIYQFFVHTRAVRRLGPLEAVFATPSHHRVHHGSQRRHLDRNYGGFFILFDRMLGTFTPEDTEPTYGVPGGYDRASPMFANLYMVARLIAASTTMTSGRERLRLWFGPPEASSHLVGAAAHARPSHPGVGGSLIGIWGPFVAGLGGAAVVALGRSHLPVLGVVMIGIASIVLLEIGSARLDRRA